MKVQLLQYTPEPEKTIAAAAKLCYSSVGVDDIMDKLTDENTEKFLNMLMSYGHASPIEHVSFTFAVEGVSRALTHQLVRHRIASYSQQSQRYVKLEQFEYIIPPAIQKNYAAKTLFIKHMENSQKAYDDLVELMIIDQIMNFSKLSYEDRPSIDTELFKKENPKEYKKFEKIAIEDARYVFPNACETKIVLTMNARTLMNFFNHRCCTRSQWEIRTMAILMLKEVRKVAPTLFKKAGASCISGPCPEGSMSCHKSKAQ